MNVNELIKKLQKVQENGDGEREIVIETNQNSLCKTPSVDIVSVWCGFDWDKNTCFIQPEESLLPMRVGRDEEIEPIIKNGQYENGRKWVSIRCRKCDHKLTKTDRYCPRCGQKIANKRK